MKITDLQLQQYGIYRDVSWQPAQRQLVVVMGENESGKTTLLNFIRDMLFGYRRGGWAGRGTAGGAIWDSYGKAARHGASFATKKTAGLKTGGGKRMLKSCRPSGGTA